MPPAAKAYWTKARQYLEKTGTEWEIVEADSKEYLDWVRYFRWLGFKPTMIAFVEKKMIESILVPSRAPEWFDTAYAGVAEPPPFPAVSYPWVPPIHPNLFVGKGRPGYNRVVEFVSEALPKFWRHKPSGKKVHRDDEYLSKEAIELEGYWVPESWYTSARRYKDWLVSLMIYNPGFRKWDFAEKRDARKRTFTEAEKAAFLEDAKRVGESIKGMKLSDAAKQTLR